LDLAYRLSVSLLRGHVLVAVLRDNQFQHVGALKRIDPFFAQQPDRVKVRRRREGVFLGDTSCHAQLASCQPFAADCVDVQFAADFFGRRHFACTGGLLYRCGAF
jgi:hypothetical protein